jgi:hypothetical protein
MQHNHHEALEGTLIEGSLAGVRANEVLECDGELCEVWSNHQCGQQDGQQTKAEELAQELQELQAPDPTLQYNEPPIHSAW